MSTSTILLVLGVLYFAAHVFAFMFQRTRVPDVLILMLIGLLIGPVLGLVQPESFGRTGAVLTTVALAVILFEGGLSLSVQSMAKSAASTLFLSMVTAAATFGVVSLAAAGLLGLSTELALLCGAILCGTSSAVVIPMVQALGLSDKTSTILVLESALTDVICIVLTFALLNAIVQGNFEASIVFGQIGASLTIALMLGLVGGVFWLKVYLLVRRFPATTFTTIAYAFILYGLTEALGFSGAIATLVFGLTITNAPNLIPQLQFPRMTEVELGFFKEVVFLLKTFFFIFLGISMKFSNLYLAVVALAVVLVVYFLRIWITRYSLPRESTPRDATLTSLLVPKGLAAAVLAGLPLQYGIAEGEMIQLFVFSAVLFSILLTAILVPVVERPRVALVTHRFFSRYKGVPEVAPAASLPSDVPKS